MPLLRDEKRIAELREQFKILTHTSGTKLEEIDLNPNVDQHGQQMGGAVFATSSDRDFYALRQPGKINRSIHYRDSDGKVKQIFIFEEMKDTYYEYGVSSENFIPIVSGEKEVFHGEWVSHDKIKPISLKIGKKEDILERTPAKVFTISNLEQFEAQSKEETFVKMVKDVKTALQAIQGLVKAGILQEANNPDGLRKQQNVDTSLEAIQELGRTKILKEANPDGLRKRPSKYGLRNRLSKLCRNGLRKRLSELCRRWQKNGAGR